MSSIEISLIALGCIFGGVLIGLFIQRFLPDHHLTVDARDVLKLGSGMIATLAALVLGLLISSAKGTFDTVNNALRQSGTLIVVLDRTMARYGPETREGRDVLRRSVQKTFDQIWGAKGNAAEIDSADADQGLDELYQKLGKLKPQNEDQARFQARALQIINQIEETRLITVQRKGQSSFPMLLVGLLICWLTIIFFSFGLLSSPNKTVMLVLFICALSMSSSLFLLLELDQPFGGMIKVSSVPMQKALAYLNR